VELTIRNARFDPADAQLYAWALDEASGGFTTQLFGSAAQDIFAEVSLRPDHEFSLTHVRLAEVDGSVVGVCSSYAAAHVPSGTRLLARAARWHALRAAAIAVVARPIVRQMSRHDPEDWYVQCLAVFPDSRGVGVGRALLDDARQRAIAAHYEWLTLDVESENTRARRMYEKAQMGVIDTSAPARLAGGVRVHRMAADLLPPM